MLYITLGIVPVTQILIFEYTIKFEQHKNLNSIKSLNQIRIYLTLLLSIIALMYIKTISFDLIFLDDDVLFYERFQDLSASEKLASAFNSNYLRGHYYRPITLTSFITENEMFGEATFIYHLTNISIHAFTSLLLFFILLKLSYSSLIAFLTSLFYAINPIQINAVGWIAGRGDLLAGLFCVIALLLNLHFIRSIRTIFIIPISILLLLAILSKELTLLIPFLFIIFYLIEHKDFKFNKRSIGIFLILILVTGSYYLLRGVLLTEVHLTKFSFTTLFRNIMVLPETISKVFLGIGIKALPGIESLTSVVGTILFVFITGLPLIVKNINKFRYYFGLIWFILLMVPGMVFRTMEHDGFFYWDCRSYLPIIGLIFVVAEILSNLNLRKKLTLSITFVYLLILALVSFNKIDIYTNPETFWNSVKSDYPDRFLPHIALYNYNIHINNFKQAEKELLTGIKKNETASLPRKLLINFYINNNKFEEAFSTVKNALEETKSEMNFLIKKFIFLSKELNMEHEIDLLLEKYSENEKIKSIIRKNL